MPSNSKFRCGSVMTQMLFTVVILLSLTGTVLTEDVTLAKAVNTSVKEMVFGSYHDFWLVKLALNLLGYASVVVPAAILINYFKKTKYDETAGPGFFSNLVKLCVFGKDKDKPISCLEDSQSDVSSAVPERSLWQQFLVLTVCFVGLQASYLTWGVLQERIMTRKYGATADNPSGERFKNSQFLVFMNRILAFVLALVVIVVRHQPKHTAPLFKYSYSSFSNIMSSWCQYEALKFVSFPTQVLAKASKIIPVMLMGKCISKRSYEYYEYVTAVLISFGVSLFLLTSGDNSTKDTITTFSGVLLMLGYMLFDSFTSNWQGELFKSYKMSSIQMMAGVNLFSCLFTVTALLEQGGFLESMSFMGRHTEIMVEVSVLSVCSATGQLFIFYTISQFGPVTFTIMMTVRQGLAIFLSCLIYNHPMTIFGFFGVLIVFAAMFLRIYAGQRKRQKAAVLKAAASPNISKV